MAPMGLEKGPATYVLYFAALLLPTAFAQAADLIVSSVGSDLTGNGSVDKPFATLSKCVSMLKEAPTGATPAPRRCRLRGGYYAEENTIILSHLEGTLEYPFIVTAYNRDGEPPVVVDGTAPLTNLKWSKSGQDKDVWSTVVVPSEAPNG